VVSQALEVIEILVDHDPEAATAELRQAEGQQVLESFLRGRAGGAGETQWEDAIYRSRGLMNRTLLKDE
jgi:hypothetical protein